LHFSPSFREYAEGLASRLVAVRGVRGGTVVEVGCGDGYFLGLLARLGGCRAHGFDPAFDAGRAGVLPEGVTIHAREFGAGDAGLRARLVVCRHVLEHIWSPVAFLASLRGAMGGAGGEGAIFVEVPNGRWLVESRAVWDVIYEHCTYYTPGSLARVLEAAGFAVERVEAAYGDQFLTALARVGSPGAGAAKGPNAGEAAAARGFGEGHREKVGHWTLVLAERAARRERVALWGAGSKGVTFLNALGSAAAGVACAVDANPRKQGCFIAGAGHEIVAPASLAAQRPAAVIVMNPLYQKEVAGALAQLGLSPEVLVA
ncbi:MAG: class I SAM-dependent methyltransferase, partial [Phycisphaerales bacterium]